MNFIQKNIKKTENKVTATLLRFRNTSKPIVIYGAGWGGYAYLQALRHHGLEVIFFCDDNKEKQGTIIDGIEVIHPAKLRELNTDYGIVIATYCNLIPRLEQEGLIEKYLPLDLSFYEEGMDYFDFYCNHADELEFVYNKLNDDKSRFVFLSAMQYRVSRDSKLIKAINDGEKRIYFCEDIFTLHTDEVFVDLGAFIGDSVLSFVNNCPVSGGKNVFGHIHAFEPEKGNFEILKKNTSNWSNKISYYNVGAYDKKSTQKFFSNTGYGSSSISETGTSTVMTERLDDLIHDKVTYLKADIEGSELAALRGGENLLRVWQPKVALSIYHKPEDFFTLPLFVDAKGKYKFYMRHYSHLAGDTVFYAIPY